MLALFRMILSLSSQNYDFSENKGIFAHTNRGQFTMYTVSQLSTQAHIFRGQVSYIQTLRLQAGTIIINLGCVEGIKVKIE